MNITIVMIITGNFHFLCITYENDFYNKYIFLLLITEKKHTDILKEIIAEEKMSKRYMVESKWSLHFLHLHFIVYNGHKSLL